MKRAQPLPLLPVSDQANDEDASGVTLEALLASEIEVVRSYHDLAIRHDALVDDVLKELRRRAGQK